MTSPTSSSTWVMPIGSTHDAAAATFWLREAVRRNPADGRRAFRPRRRVGSRQQQRRSHREKELARRLSSTYAARHSEPARDPVPRGLERLKPQVELPHARRIDAEARRQRAAQSARSSRISTWNGRSGCSSRKTIATRLSS